MADDEDILGQVGMPELFRRVLDAHRRTLRTATAGKILAYNRTGDERNTADVELPIQPDGEEQASLSHCPVLVLGGGDGYLMFPYSAEDTGLVVFCDTEIGRWRQSGDIGEPADDGRLNSAGPVLIPGLRSVADATAIPTSPAGATVLAASDLRLGSWSASKAVVHEDLLGDLNTFLTALNVWATTAHANWAAAAAAWPAGPGVPLAALQAGIAGGDYESPTAKVDD